MNNEEVKKILSDEIEQITKDHGAGSIMIGDGNIVDIESISSGSIALDVATGIGGFPKGRIVEVYGPESSGKTTITLHAIANAQKAGGLAAFIDAEHALDASYAKNLGVDFDQLVFSQPDSGEEALDIAEKLIDSGKLDLVVIDSVAALVPKAELDGTMDANHIGAHARLMSKTCRKIKGKANKTNTCVIFINQIREKIGVMFGSPETTTGGRALKFYASMRVEIRKIGTVSSGGEKSANKTKGEIKKNKCAPPFRKCEFMIVYGKGVDPYFQLLTLSQEKEFSSQFKDLISKKGSHYDIAGIEGKCNGMDNAAEALKKNPEVFDELYGKLRDVALANISKTGQMD